MIFSFDRFVFDSDQRILRNGTEVVPVPPKALEMLEVFVASEGRVLSKREIIQTLWPDSFVEESNLTQNIFVLRKALGHSVDGQPLILTLSKRGYRFTSTVHRREVLPAEMAVQVPERQEEPDAVPGEARIGELEAPAPVERAALRWPRGGIVAMVVMVCVGVLLWGRLRAPVRVGPITRLTNDGRVKSGKPMDRVAPVIESGGELVFNESVDGQNRIGRIPAAGGATAVMPPLAAEESLVGAGQGSRTLLLSGAWSGGEPDGRMVEQSLETGATREIRDVYGHDGSWSPNGKQLAYSQYGELLLRTGEDGGVRVAPIARVSGRVYWPRWSPDGSRIRFSESFDGYHDEMWEVNADGSNLHLIFQEQPDRNHVCCGSWTRDGRGFVYLSLESNGSNIVLAAEPQRWWSPSSKIAAGPLDAWGGPTPGADGKHVYAMGEQMHGRLVRIDPVTRAAEPYLDGLSVEGVSFSPDGKWLAYTSYPEGTLWRSRVNGSERVKLTKLPLLSRFPRWSPDGKTILFLAGQAGSNWELYTVAAGGGAVKRLMRDELGQGVGNWSRDGGSIYFGRLLDYAHDGPQRLRIEQLRLQDGTTTVLPGSGGMWTARLSPDGRYLSAVSSDNQTLRLFDLATNTWTDAARVSVNDVVWSPDAQYVFFDVNRGDEWLIYRLRVADRRLENGPTCMRFGEPDFFLRGWAWRPMARRCCWKMRASRRFTQFR